jgi:aryl-alcohol dehydrogenase-like predicted oxidoreductase
MSHYDFSEAAIKQSIECSLERLRTDYLDIVFVHSNGLDQRIIEEDKVFATLSILKDQGKIRAFGMSTKSVHGGLLTVDLADVAMVTLNPTHDQDKEVIAYAQQKQKGIFIKKALTSGHLSSSVSERLRYVFAESGVTSVIVGTINVDHLRENVCALSSTL